MPKGRPAPKPKKKPISPPADADSVISLSSDRNETLVTPTKRARVPSAKAAANKSSVIAIDGSSDDEIVQKKRRTVKLDNIIEDEDSSEPAWDEADNVLQAKMDTASKARTTPKGRSSNIKPKPSSSRKGKGKQTANFSPSGSENEPSDGRPPKTGTSNTARLGGTPTDWEDSFDENEGNIVSKGSVTGRYIKTAASESQPSPKTCEVMNNEIVKASMDPNLASTYQSLVNLNLVAFTGYETREEDMDGLQMFRHWKRSMPPTFSLKFAKEVVCFSRSGHYINLSRIDPAILYLREVGSKGGSQYFTDNAGTAYMCLTSGRCVQSRLVNLQHAPTSRGNEQNYWKYIDISPHTVEFERLAAAAGMASHLNIVETSLIGGNALRITTRSGKMPAEQSQDRNATGSSPHKSAATVAGSSARLGKSIAWSISPFDTIPIFDAVDKTFSLDKDTLHDLAGTAGLKRFQGEVPPGSMVLVGYTGSWWCPTKTQNLRLGFNLNWVVVLGVPK